MTDSYFNKAVEETEVRLRVVRQRFGEISRQIEPLAIERDICQAAINKLEENLARRKLCALGLNNHIVEFNSDHAGPNPRRMLVSGSEMSGADLILTGKVFTAKGALSKDDWSVSSSRVRDCGLLDSRSDKERTSA